MPTLIVAISYLLGSIPYAYLMGLSKGKDVSKEGSGNVGTANALHVLGLKAAALTLFLDMGKGFLAAYIGSLLLPGGIGSFLGGAAAVLGHNWSIFLKGRGGKGLATTAGVLIFIKPILLLPLLAILLLLNAVTSYIAISSVLTSLMLPFFFFLLDGGPGLLFGLSVMVMIGIKHGPNLKATFQGQEEKINILAELIKRGK